MNSLHLKPRIPLKFPLSQSSSTTLLRQLLRDSEVDTVCEAAGCPNLSHCWNRGSATIMIMGKKCTRRCKFCRVSTGHPEPLDPNEPVKVAQLIKKMRLKHIVITSVNRDDLSDGGSRHFAAVVKQVRKYSPEVTVEVLIPDFKARIKNLKHLWETFPSIINHNVETVPSLYKTICPQSDYEISLRTLRLSAGEDFITKSGILLGLGEPLDEVYSVIYDLKKTGIQMLTIGQYLPPGPENAHLIEYFPDEIFNKLKDYALGIGIGSIMSHPLVRSSYHAGDSINSLRKRLNSEKNS